VAQPRSAKVPLVEPIRLWQAQVHSNPAHLLLRNKDIARVTAAAVSALSAFKSKTRLIPLGFGLDTHDETPLRDRGNLLLPRDRENLLLLRDAGSDKSG
jgi:hypothetical protein